MEGASDESIQENWLTLGLVVAFLHYVFLLVIIVLLQIDFYLAMALGIVISIASGIIVTVYVRFVY